MFFLAGLGASSAIDLISSLSKSLDGAKTKTGVTAQSTAFNWIDPSASAASSANTTATGSTTGTGSVSSDTMRALLMAQSEGANGGGGKLAKLFSALDADGSGGISEIEFDKVFSKNPAKADDVFAKLDTDKDGAISAKELLAGLKAKPGHKSADEAGKNDAANTVTNADGSTTTTITYGDGSTVTMTRPAGEGASAENGNFLERMIARQAQMLSQTANGQTLALSA